MTRISNRNYAQPHWRPGRAVDVVSKTAIPNFMALLDAITRQLGSEAAACKACGINQSSIWNARRHESMTAPVAQKILATYKRLKNEKKLQRTA